MKRKFLVVAIAVIVLALGLWEIAIFFWPTSSTPTNTILKVVHLVGGIILFRAGDNLIQFKEFGRKFVLVLLFIRVAWGTFFAVLAVFFGQGFAISSDFFGTFSLMTVNPSQIVLLIFGWGFIPLLMAGFLLQKETRVLFLPEIKSAAGAETTLESSSNQ